MLTFKNHPKAKVLVCDTIHEDGIKMLRDASFQVDLQTKITSEELIKVIENYDALVVRSRTKVTKDVLAAGKRLKVVARAGVGLDNVDVDSARSRGIQVVNSPEAPSNAVAELVVGFMLSLARRIPEADVSMKRGEWIKSRLTGLELRGRTTGIIGFGRIGYLVAKKAKAMEMRVLVYDVVINKLMGFVNEVGAESVNLDNLLSSSDFITVHVPLLKETKHIIGIEEIGKMKKTAYLINTSRGAIVDENALREAIMSGSIAGAALDVFEEEPPKGTELTGLGNVVCTPHIGAETEEAQRANSTIVAEKIIKILNGA